MLNNMFFNAGFYIGYTDILNGTKNDGITTKNSYANPYTTEI